MKIDLIFTFEDQPQQRDNLPFVVAILADKDTLIDFVTAKLSMADIQQLVKISCCIEWFNGYEKNQLSCAWYDDARGKIWTNDLEAWRKVRGIKSAVTQEYLKQFGYLD